MLAEDKLKALEILLEKIREEVPTATVKEIKVNEEGNFEGYVIVPIANTNITILENLNDNVKEALFLADNSQIEKVVRKMTKSQAKQQEGIETANHTEGFAGYVDRLVKKARSLLIYPEKALKQKGVKRKSKEWLARFRNPKEKSEAQIGEKMGILPMNKKNNLFFKLIIFFKKIFYKQKNINNTEFQNDRNNTNTIEDFQENVKVEGLENEAISKIQMQKERMLLLENFAKNTDLIDKLSMEELVQLEKLYDEELKKNFIN